MKSTLFLTLFTISLATSATVRAADCTDEKMWKKHKSLCKHLIDPNKFKKGETDRIDCTEPPKDPYELDLCKKANLMDQMKMGQKVDIQIK